MHEKTNACFRGVIDFLTEKKVQRLCKGTGFYELSLAPQEICTSDMCYAAAERLLAEKLVRREDIGALIFISQTADYLSPATAYSLQKRLELPRDLLAFDINLGCSGFVYGVYVAGSLARSLQKKVLLCVGDTSSRNAYPNDTSMLSIAADAGASAIVEPQLGHNMTFNIESLGEQVDALVIPRGGARGNRLTDSDGGLLSVEDNYVQMDGMAVMNFSLKDVPNNIKALLASIGLAKPSIAYLHQGNKMIVQSIAGSIGIDPADAPFNSGKIGNTSSASIPLVLTELARTGEYAPQRDVLMSGFGVGMSIASLVMDMETTAVLPTIEI